jgi:hypothetical protein
VAGVGRHAELGLRVLQDDLSLPKGNKSKVRIVQASVQVPVLGVSLTNGPSIAENVAFATTTEYFVVDPGSWQLQIRPATGGQSTKLSATLGSGNVYSLLIVDAGQGTLKTQLFADAQKGRGLPYGGVATGGGGTAGSSNMPTYLIVGASVLLLALVTGVVVRLRRRRTTL